MLAATSWAARLKAGLARTREVLNTDVGELLVRRRIASRLPPSAWRVRASPALSRAAQEVAANMDA